MTMEVNSAAILSLRLTEQPVGPWSAVLEADSDKDLGGTLRLDLDSETFVGTALQAHNEAGRYKATVVGGGGGLEKILEACHYNGATAGTILADICGESGEKLDPSILPAITLKRFSRWTRLKGAAQSAIRELAGVLEVQWRITRAGLLWLGTDTWLPLKPSVIETDFDPQHRVRTVAYDGLTERPVIKPGVTVEGQRIATTVLLYEMGSLRHELYLDETKGPAGLVAQVLKKALELLQSKIDLSRFYPGKAVGHGGADTGVVTVLMDDRLVAGKWKGLDRVPLSHGVPGVTLRLVDADGKLVPGGARVRLCWDAGDPSRPRAALWDDGAPVHELCIAVTDTIENPGTSRLRLGSASASDFVALSSLVTAQLNALKAAIDAAATTESGAGGTGGMNALKTALEAPPGWPESVAATKVTAA